MSAVSTIVQILGGVTLGEAVAIGLLIAILIRTRRK